MAHHEDEWVYTAWTPVPVPKPSTALLTGLGLLGMGNRARYGV